LSLTNLSYVNVDGNRLDLSVGSPAENVVSTLRSRGVGVSASNQRP
jgi:hypothetical protein